MSGYSEASQQGEDIDLFKKHNAMVHISGRLTALQRRMSNVLLANAYFELPTRDRHSIPIGVLASLSGFNSHNYEVLKSALRKLNVIQVEYDVIERARHGDVSPDWGVTTIIAEAQISGGLVHYAYSPRMREMLYQPETYTELSLRMQANLRSAYALALYETCKRYLRVGSTGFLEVPIWRKLLMGPESEGAMLRFGDFNRCAITKSVKAINERCDIRVEPFYQRAGRTVHKIRFSVAKSGRFDELVRGVACESTDGKSMSEALAGIGIARGIAQTLVNEYGVTQCRDVVNHLREKEKSGGKAIRNPAGWVVTMLSKGAGGDQASVRRREPARPTLREAGRNGHPTHEMPARRARGSEADMATLADFEAFDDAVKRKWTAAFRRSLPASMRAIYDRRGHWENQFTALFARFLRERGVSS